MTPLQAASLARANQIANAQRIARLAASAASVSSTQEPGARLRPGELVAGNGAAGEALFAAAGLTPVVRHDVSYTAPRPGWLRRLWFRLTGR